MVRLAYLAIVLFFSSAVFAYDKDFFKIQVLEYPVVTNSMVSAIGNIDIKLDYKPLRSLAIVGADELSAQWLRLNNDYLMSIGAVGLVINVESAEQLKILQQYTDIPLVASPGYDFADHFGSVYPLIIDATAGRVRQ